MSGTIRQLEERQLPAEVTLMRWSPNMDLLAIANVKGELALHRLTWQRVWLLSPQEETDTIANISWRPDGKLIAVIYGSSKLLCLVDIENKNIVHKILLKLATTTNSIAWLSLSQSDGDINNSSISNASTTGEYLPPLPNLTRSFGQEPERKEFLSQTLDMLFLGQDDGNIFMYVFGMFYCGTVNVGNGPILEICGGSGKALWVRWKDVDCIKIVRLSCPLLENNKAFLKVAQIQSHVECLMDYLSRTFMAISEAWETILLEMDEKLTRYAENKPPGSVAADFLELLMIGIPTHDLETFLLRDLTEKGLKKLGHSIEMCYSNIQKLVLNHLSSVGMALLYHLGEMRGMVRLGGPYRFLGLADEVQITNAIQSAQTFLAKTSEIQQVIDHSMRDYQAFFRWLYVVIMRLQDERVPSEMSRVSQQDLTYIAEFLRGFDKAELGESKRKGVNLEKLGQYLRRESLQTCFSPDGSEWATMLEENQCLLNHPLIIKQDFNCSLLQSHAKLVDAINDVFSNAYQDLTKHFNTLSISLVSSSSILSSQFVSVDGNLMVGTLDSNNKLLRLFNITHESPMNTLTSNVVYIDVENNHGLRKTDDHVITDLQFYSFDYLSILLVNEHTYASCLIQLSINHERILDDRRACQDETRQRLPLNLKDLIDATLSPPFHDISARQLSVSGARKVAAVLGDNKRKIRLLETEVQLDDEEEDEEDQEGGDDSMMEITTAINTSHCNDL